MKKIFIQGVFLPLLFLLVWGCQDDMRFPDPGFDLMTGKNITIRRDTADSYVISLKVNAPAGIDVIQILDGRNYQVLEELPEYKGKKEFQFQHAISFKEIPNTQDSVLMRMVRIVTLDTRAYNSSFKINVKKLSVPEVLLPHNNILGVASPIVGIRALITTGINKIAGIKVYIEGQEKYAVPVTELEGLSEYKLTANIQYPFVQGQEYLMRIEVADTKGQVHQEDITVKGVEMRRPKGIQYELNGKPYGYYTFGYDEKHRIQYADFENYVNASASTKAEFIYREDGKVTQVNYLYGTWNWQLYLKFAYDSEGRLMTSMLGRYMIEDESQVFVFPTAQNFVYRGDGTVKQFDVGVNTIEEVQYTDGFMPDEKICTESWMTLLSSISKGNRRVKADFIPILFPTYIEGLPIFCMPQFMTEFNDIFCYKYVYTLVQPGYGNTESAATYWPSYTYTTNEEGMLETFVRKSSVNTAQWMTLRFLYE